MKLGVVIGGIIFVLGLAFALLSIYVLPLGLGPPGWQTLPKAISSPIAAVDALERTHPFYKWLLYLGLGNMIVGSTAMLASPVHRVLAPWHE